MRWQTRHALSAVRAEKVDRQQRRQHAARAPCSRGKRAGVCDERGDVARRAADAAHRQNVEVLAPDAENGGIAAVRDADAPRCGRAVRRELLGGVEEALGAGRGPQLLGLARGRLSRGLAHLTAGRPVSVLIASQAPTASSSAAKPSRTRALGRAEREPRTHDRTRDDADGEDRGDAPVDVAEQRVRDRARDREDRDGEQRGGDGALDVESRASV